MEQVCGFKSLDGYIYETQEEALKADKIHQLWDYRNTVGNALREAQGNYYAKYAPVKTLEEANKLRDALDNYINLSTELGLVSLGEEDIRAAKPKNMGFWSKIAHRLS